MEIMVNNIKINVKPKGKRFLGTCSTCGLITPKLTELTEKSLTEWALKHFDYFRDLHE